ncbi:hypothetical protein THAOC_30863, partial [Thalassiosira oceanica]
MVTGCSVMPLPETHKRLRMDKPRQDLGGQGHQRSTQNVLWNWKEDGQSLEDNARRRKRKLAVLQRRCVPEKLPYISIRFYPSSPTQRFAALPLRRRPKILHAASGRDGPLSAPSGRQDDVAVVRLPLPPVHPDRVVRLVRVVTVDRQYRRPRRARPAVPRAGPVVDLHPPGVHGHLPRGAPLALDRDHLDLPPSPAAGEEGRTDPPDGAPEQGQGALG